MKHFKVKIPFKKKPFITVARVAAVDKQEAIAWAISNKVPLLMQPYMLINQIKAKEVR